jgi:hypothetical protein
MTILYQTVLIVVIQNTPLETPTSLEDNAKDGSKVNGLRRHIGVSPRVTGLLLLMPVFGLRPVHVRFYGGITGGFNGVFPPNTLDFSCQCHSANAPSPAYLSPLQYELNI